MTQKAYRKYTDKLFLFKIGGILSALLLISLHFYWVSPDIPDNKASFVIISDSLKDDLKATLLSSIKLARKEIFIVTFSLSDPEIIHALNKQAQKGVSVIIICDDKNNSSLSKKLNHNISVYRRKQNSALMHQKIIAIDSEFAWLGSTNLTSESLTMHSNLMIGIFSTDLVENIKSRCQNYIKSGNKINSTPQFFNIDNISVALYFLPEQHCALDDLKNEINNAVHSLKIAMFTWSNTELADTIIAAKNRGVDISIIVDHLSSKGASKKCIEKLLANNIKISCNKDNNLLHHKYIFIDNSTFISGSVNWTKSGFNKNDENMLIIKNIPAKKIVQINRLHKMLLKNSTARDHV